MQKVGSWAFIIGVVIAIVAGVITLKPWLASVLIILGLIVGFLNITAAETTSFLLAVISLVIIAGFGADVLREMAVVGDRLSRIFSALLVFLIPAGIVVALKSIYAVAKEK